MQPDLVITTHADYELYEHLNAACYMLYRKKRSYIITIVATIVLGFYLGFTSYLENDKFLLYVLTPIWIVVFLGLSLFLMRTSAIAKRAAKRSVKFSQNAFASIQYVFFQDHMEIASENAQLQTPYNQIETLAETSKFYLLFTNRVNAHCVRKKDLGPSNVNLFREYMQDKTGRSFQQLKY